MVRGADYDNKIPQSDNPIENGPDQIHGLAKPNNLSRAHKAAPLPEENGSGRTDVFPGQGSGGYENTSGSGKGGHEPEYLDGRQ